MREISIWVVETPQKSQKIAFKRKLFPRINSKLSDMMSEDSSVKGVSVSGGGGGSVSRQSSVKGGGLKGASISRQASGKGGTGSVSRQSPSISRQSSVRGAGAGAGARRAGNSGREEVVGKSNSQDNQKEKTPPRINRSQSPSMRKQEQHSSVNGSESDEEIGGGAGGGGVGGRRREGRGYDDTDKPHVKSIRAGYFTPVDAVAATDKGGGVSWKQGELVVGYVLKYLSILTFLLFYRYSSSDPTLN